MADEVVSTAAHTAKREACAEPHPTLLELVRVLARDAAEADYAREIGRAPPTTQKDERS